MSKIDKLYSIKLHADILSDNILEEGQNITDRDAKIIKDHVIKAINRLNFALRRTESYMD